MTADPVIAFRTDASLEIGSGHVMRCLTLADALASQGGRCHFLCRSHPGHAIDIIRARGHTVHVLPDTRPWDTAHDAQAPAHAAWLGCHWATDAEQSDAILKELGPDWLVVDHYALDARWERQVVPHGCRLLVIDDLADRSHVADLLLDQNLGRDTEDYRRWLPESCRLLVGPRYALLRPEFREWREASLARRHSSEMKRILISLGGVDKDNATGRVLDTLKNCDLPEHCRISVVMGGSAPWLESVRHQAEGMPRPTEVAVNVSNMAERMAHADLAIGAAGSTSWERCCLGLPTLMVVLAENQRIIAKSLEQWGAGMWLDAESDHGWEATLATRMDALKDDSSALQRLSDHARKIVDGLGTERVRSSMDERLVP